MLKVIVIGSGNVAQHLIKAFKNSGKVELVQAYARNPGKLEHILSLEYITDSIQDLKEADVYIISVTDDAIDNVSKQLPFSNRLVVHTSGSTPLEKSDAKNRRGVFYPLQTFSKNKDVDFKEIPLCLEAEHPDDYNALEELAKSISPLTYSISSEQRQALHVAAVFVNNFTNHLYVLGSRVCDENNIPFDILKPLIHETADKIKTVSPINAQTGPAKRNDKTTIQRHLDFIKDPMQKDIYRLLTQSIQRTNG
ncbi:Rossmann-like and DUF2520 domain-containing protein [Flavobacterium sp. AG291]|uniref:Rossmann-like and DUF2520 domain-containing protein n=1 Tax=Flavobacterium sp. AG291 TaxID=2184000 RepID=UPI000E0B1A88|nr:F420-dependent NADP oxidoreductase [Flavobacterium sp. AG291]RDI14355.1 coenzyme F420-dependent NADP oxidoreductase-like protein [Flavobacterium sp. AG291]